MPHRGASGGRRPARSRSWPCCSSSWCGTYAAGWRRWLRRGGWQMPSTVLGRRSGGSSGSRRTSCALRSPWRVASPSCFATQHAVPTCQRTSTSCSRSSTSSTAPSSGCCGWLPPRMPPCVLRLARAEDAPLRLAHVELASLVERTARRWQGAVPARCWSVQSPRMDVLVDPVRLGLALDSMIENAVRHTDPDGSITLRAVHRGDTLAFEVRDDGPGIALAELALVFEGFHSTGPHGGTGLGLAIVKAVATAHNGSVEADNAPGGGAVVTLVLPLPAATEIVPPPRSAMSVDGSVMMRS